jgi:hypothetical protein
MRCAKCHRNEATIQFVPVVDGQPQAPVHLCQDCAADPRARSIEAIYRRVTPEEFARLQSDAKAAESFFSPKLDELVAELMAELNDPEKLPARRPEQEDSVRILFIGTDWHALHFLLTGEGELKPHPWPSSPLGKVVRGGAETPWPCTSGHVRSLMPDEVRAVADALTKVTVGELRARFSAASFNAAQITPPPGQARWTDEDAESVFGIYPQVVDFFQSTARAGDIILLSFQ